MPCGSRAFDTAEAKLPSETFYWKHGFWEDWRCSPQVQHQRHKQGRWLERRAPDSRCNELQAGASRCALPKRKTKRQNASARSIPSLQPGCDTQDRGWPGRGNVMESLAKASYRCDSGGENGLNFLFPLLGDLDFLKNLSCLTLLNMGSGVGYFARDVWWYSTVRWQSHELENKERTFFMIKQSEEHSHVTHRSHVGGWNVSVKM